MLQPAQQVYTVRELTGQQQLARWHKTERDRLTFKGNRLLVFDCSILWIPAGLRHNSKYVTTGCLSRLRMKDPGKSHSLAYQGSEQRCARQGSIQHVLRTLKIHVAQVGGRDM